MKASSRPFIPVDFRLNFPIRAINGAANEKIDNAHKPKLMCGFDQIVASAVDPKIDIAELAKGIVARHPTKSHD